MNVTEAKRIALADKWPTTTGDAALVLADEVGRLESQLSMVWAEFRSQRADLRDELARIRTDYEAQLEAVHDLTETLAEERVQHAAQVDRVRVELARVRAEYASEMALDDAIHADTFGDGS